MNNGAKLATHLLDDDIVEAMGRRGFFRHLGVGVLGAVAAPHLLAQAAAPAAAAPAVAGAWTVAMEQSMNYLKARFHLQYGPEGWAAHEAKFREAFMYPDVEVQLKMRGLLNSPVVPNSPPLNAKQQELLQQYAEYVAAHQQPQQPQQQAQQPELQRPLQQNEPRTRPARRAVKRVYTSRERSQDRRGIDAPGIPRQDEPRFGETRTERITSNAAGLVTSLLS